MRTASIQALGLRSMGFVVELGRITVFLGSALGQTGLQGVHDISDVGLVRLVARLIVER